MILGCSQGPNTGLGSAVATGGGGTAAGGPGLAGATAAPPSSSASGAGGGAPLGGAPPEQPPGSGGTAATSGGSGAVNAGSAGTAADAGSGGSGGPSLVGDVAFSTPSQSFKGQLQVSLTTSVAGAEIRYTTDGTAPSAASTVYSGAPLGISATTQIRAQAFVGGTASGKASTAIYIARTFDATSSLPIVIIDGYGGGKSTDKNLFLGAAVMVFEPENGTASLENLPTLTTRAGYHLRGQSSAQFDQRPYRVEFRDNADQDADHPLLGMPSDSDWALIPPYYDRTLIRNPLAYTLGKDLGLDAPRTAFAEIYLNYESRALTEADYQGIYWVSETIKNQKARVNLKQLDEKDTSLPAISGGYIWKFDQLATEEPTLACTGAQPIRDSLGGGFGGPGGGRPIPGGGSAGAGNTPAGTCWTDLEIVDPVPLNAEQKSWISRYIQEFHDSLHATPIGDYESHMDLPSFVDYFLLNELSRNVDAYVRSAYYHKDRDGKIQAGPLWDYNFAFAVGGTSTVDPAGGFQVDGGRNVNNWYPKLMTDAKFRAALKARWQALRQAEFSEAAIDQRVTTLIAPLTPQVIAKDFAKWPVSHMLERGRGGFIPIAMPSAETFEGQVQALRDYLRARLTRLDTLINQL